LRRAQRCDATQRRAAGARPRRRDGPGPTAPAWACPRRLLPYPGPFRRCFPWMRSARVGGGTRRPRTCPDVMPAFPRSSRSVHSFIHKTCKVICKNADRATTWSLRLPRRERLIPRPRPCIAPVVTSPKELARAAAIVAALIAALGLPMVASANKEHRVRDGQTLSAIARRYDVGVTSLAAANGISRGQPLRVGQVLRIPEAGVVFVQSGQTISSIANAHHVS